MDLRKVFERITKSKLHFKIKKYKFEKDYIKLLGYKIRYWAVEVDPLKNIIVCT